MDTGSPHRTCGAGDDRLLFTNRRRPVSDACAISRAMVARTGTEQPSSSRVGDRRYLAPAFMMTAMSTSAQEAAIRLAGVHGRGVRFTAPVRGAKQAQEEVRSQILTITYTTCN